jgi:lipid A 3-O-deacylase
MNLSRSKCVVLCVVICSYSNLAQAKIGSSFAFGSGTKQVQAYRLGMQKDWTTSGFGKKPKKFQGYWELAFTKINSALTFSCPSNSHVQVVSAAAVLRIPFKMYAHWYVDIGIGAAQFSQQEIATRELGSKLLFEDRAGIGILLGRQQQIEVGYRFLHYSNAYLAQKNQSINLHLVLLGFWFN